MIVIKKILFIAFLWLSPLLQAASGGLNSFLFPKTVTQTNVPVLTAMITNMRINVVDSICQVAIGVDPVAAHRHLTETPLIVPTHLVDGKQLAFTVVSSNVLDESLYQKFLLKNGEKSGMAWERREKILGESLSHSQQLGNADVLCLQEFNEEAQKMTSDFLSSNAYQGGASFGIPTPGTWCKSSKFATHMIPYQPFKTQGAEKNGFCISCVTPKDVDGVVIPGIVIGVINVHLNNDTPSTTTYEQFRTSQLQEILNQVEEYKECSNWIICGDCNTDRKTHPGIMQILVEAGFVDAHQHQPATARSSQGHLKSIDYLWYKGPNVSLKGTDIYPPVSDFSRLLAHRAGDVEGNFFTDHAILKATFHINLK